MYHNIIDINTSSLEDIEKHIIKKRLLIFGGNRTKTARSLVICSLTLRRKLKKWGVPNKNVRKNNHSRNSDVTHTVKNSSNQCVCDNTK